MRSLFTGCTYTFKSFFYVPVSTACLLPPPTCAVDTTTSTCSVTFTADAVCSATYAWTDVSAAVTCTPTGNTCICSYNT